MRYLRFSLLICLGPFVGLAFQADPFSGQSNDPPILKVPEGFKAEILYNPMASDSSSWVALAMDSKGRLLASDQYGALYRIRPAALGSDSATTQVEKLDIGLGHAQGLLWAFNSLYVVVNSEEGVDGRSSGLYRALDTNGDDQFDTIDRLATFDGWGEHGPHSILLGPDGSSLYVVAGNHTELPTSYESLVPEVWQEDQVLPALRDPRGHASDRMAPGGWIARTDSLGLEWEMVATGFRNTFDMAFNEAGDLFAFDSDMEWDMGMPWYRPIRVVHVTSGSEFGWRRGSGKWPAHYPDSLPSLVDIGQGSPTGVVSGANAAFPARYRKGLFVFDWSFGTIYWVSLQEDGSSYSGDSEEFLSGVPLPLTDGLIGPDGALYFSTGGRELDSYLIRVSYVGDESTSRTAQAPELNAEQRLRRSLEAFHGHQDPQAVRSAWPHLNHEDRHVRFAARVAVEHQPVSTWQNLVFAEEDPSRRMYAVIALARHGEVAQRDEAYRALLSIDTAEISATEQLDLVRAYSLVTIRLGAPEGDIRSEIVAVYDAQFPGADEVLNREVGRLLAALQAPGITGKMLALLARYNDLDANVGLLLSDSVIARSEQYGPDIANMIANMPRSQEIDLVLNLRGVTAGWTLAQRTTYFQWFYDALRKSGGWSYVGFLESIRFDALENVPMADREVLADLTDAYSAQAFNFADLPQPEGPPRNWNRKELNDLMDDELMKPRNLEVGRRMYEAALCQACHVMGGVGGTVGPDLSQIGTRASKGDILMAINLPSNTISDQYAAALLTMNDGKTIIGRVIGEEDDAVTLNQNPYAPDQRIRVLKADIAKREVSPVSIMPPRLLNRLNEEEVNDIMAFLLSGGDPEHACYTNERGCLHERDN